VAAGVGDGFLRDPVQRSLNRCGDRLVVANDADLDIGTGGSVLGKVFDVGDALQRCEHGSVVVAERADHLAHLVQRHRCRSFDHRHCFVGARRIEPRHCPRRLGLDCDPRHVMRNRVVQLAGDALPLITLSVLNPLVTNLHLSPRHVAQQTGAEPEQDGRRRGYEHIERLGVGRQHRYDDRERGQPGEPEDDVSARRPSHQ
jgi:hypothetical protein